MNLKKPCLTAEKRARTSGVLAQCRGDRLHFCGSQVQLGETPRPRESRFQRAGHHMKISIEISRTASIPTPPCPKRKTGVGSTEGVTQWPEIVLGSCFASRHGESRMDVPSASWSMAAQRASSCRLKIFSTISTGVES